MKFMQPVGVVPSTDCYLVRRSAKLYAMRACSGGAIDHSGKLFDVDFALLSDATGKTHGTVRVDTATNRCEWLRGVGP